MTWMLNTRLPSAPTTPPPRCESISLQKQLTVNSETATAVLMGAVGFLLLIACANVANIFLAVAVTRRK